MVAPLEVEGQGDGGRQRVVGVDLGDRLMLQFAGRGVDLCQGIDLLITAIESGNLDLSPQAEVAGSEAEDRPFVSVPTPGGVGLGGREQVLRKERNAPIQVDIHLVHQREGVYRQRHPTV